jgi:hypothetical protein
MVDACASAWPRVCACLDCRCDTKSSCSRRTGSSRELPRTTRTQHRRQRQGLLPPLLLQEEEKVTRRVRWPLPWACACGFASWPVCASRCHSLRITPDRSRRTPLWPARRRTSRTPPPPPNSSPAEEGRALPLQEEKATAWQPAVELLLPLVSVCATASSPACAGLYRIRRTVLGRIVRTRSWPFLRRTVRTPMPSWDAVGAGLNTDCEKEWGSSDVKRALIASHTSVASSRIAQIASGQNQAAEERRGGGGGERADPKGGNGGADRQSGGAIRSAV